MEEFIHQWHVHPMVVHFPIALFTMAVVFEVLSWVTRRETFHRTAFYLFLSAVIFTPIAVFTGHEEAEEIHLVSHPVFNQHRDLAFLTMYASLAATTILLLIKAKVPHMFRKLFVVIILGSAIMVALTAYHGGHLVYEYGVGVSP